MKNYFIRTGVFTIVILFFIYSLPITAMESDYYQNSFVLVVGSCETVDCPILWKLGLFIPLLKKNFFVATTNQPGEMINIIVKNEQTAFLFSEANASIRMNNARGVYYWAGNSPVIQNSSLLFIFGRAQDIWIFH